MLSGATSLDIQRPATSDGLKWGIPIHIYALRKPWKLRTGRCPRSEKERREMRWESGMGNATFRGTEIRP